MQSYVIILTIIGLAGLGMTWMPSISKRTKISYSVMYVLAGAIIYLAAGSFLPLPDPMYQNAATLRLTELVVIVSLMGSGLKIDQRFSISSWTAPFRLVSITMLLSIALVTTLSHFVLGLDLPSSLLLGAVLAPTDPVLASDVQVGPPLETKHNPVKFTLTAEAGMNDGTAFPFTWLAIILAGAVQGEADWQHWLLRDVFLKIAVGVAAGFILGKGLSFLLFRLPAGMSASSIKDGFVAISATLAVYGITELVHGYGFFAVFVAAVTIRNAEPNDKYHQKMHAFTDQIERILVAVVLLLFGGSLVSGVLDGLTPLMAAFSLVFVLLIRPLTAWIGLIRIKLAGREKLAISFFGIKGIGSFFYLAFALEHVFFSAADALWTLTSFTVLLSIIVHGLTATSIMDHLEPHIEKDLPVDEEKGS